MRRWETSSENVAWGAMSESGSAATSVIGRLESTGGASPI